MAEAKKHTEQEIQEALALLERTKEQRKKQQERIKNNPEMQAKQKERGRRLMIKNRLMLQKAVAAGIVVTDKEIDAELAKKV